MRKNVRTATAIFAAPSRRRARGMTLLETMLACFLMAIVLGILARGLVSGTNAMTQTQTMVDLQTAPQNIFNQMLIDIRETSGSDVNSAFSLSTASAMSPAPSNVPANGFIHFKKNNGWNSTTGQIDWVGPVEYYFQYTNPLQSAASSDVGGLGADLDGNGSIGIGYVVRREMKSDGTIATTIAGTDVLEGGFLITAPANGTIPANALINVKIACAKRLRDGTYGAAQFENQVYVRNN
jgi:type II secretory pathway pseudopilin PulG